MYRIIDQQIPYRYFAGGAVFNSKEAVRGQLISYHLGDTLDEEDAEVILHMTIDELLDFGQWELEKIN